MTPLPTAQLAVLGAVGLVLGWLVKPISVALAGQAWLVSWTQPAVLLFVALAVGATARATQQQRRGKGASLEAHQGVNRLALGRATAYVGALVAGVYGGYAVAWLGIPSDYAHRRLLWSGLAALAAAGVVGCGVLLERACRIVEDDDED
ncbi:DUF3180 domain-containing protein [Nocardioides acrostichi]|uniref:DUF3180 domain-containing protein n=1 Tax=Nocardioides acrostichi TaxID=2784339 RepID=A0A930Y813_9ACTN|nr:DUF3180 domain-containing protein [Nocardioides acrostichi]MBF4162622.1 DUF3180 domain-containing protein [Nocardioides acrostichi]